MWLVELFEFAAWQYSHFSYLLWGLLVLWLAKCESYFLICLLFLFLLLIILFLEIISGYDGIVTQGVHGGRLAVNYREGRVVGEGRLVGGELTVGEHISFHL